MKKLIIKNIIVNNFTINNTYFYRYKIKRI